MTQVHWLLIDFRSEDIKEPQILELDNTVLTAEFQDNDEVVVNEIYWSPGKGGRIKKNPQAIWSPEKGLRKFHPSFNQLRNLEGIPVQISVCQNKRFYLSDGIKGQGYLYEIIHTLAKFLNFKVAIKYDYTNHCEIGGFNKTTQKWTGIIKHLKSKEIDLFLGLLLAAQERKAIMDFTIPVFEDVIVPIVRKRKQPFNLSSYVKSFHWHNWAVAGILCLSFSFLLSLDLIKYKYKTSGQMFFHWLYVIFCALCQKGITIVSLSSSGSILFLSINLFAILIFLYYSSLMTSILAKDTDGVSFSTAEEAVYHPEYSFVVWDIGLIPNFIEKSNNKEVQEIWKRMNVNRTFSFIRDLFGQLEKMEEEKLILFATFYSVYFHLLENKRISHFAFLRKMSSIPLSLSLSKSSLYTKLFSKNILRLWECGILQRSKNKYIRYDGTVPETTEHLKPIQLTQVSSIFLILLMIKLFSIIVCIIRCKFNKKKKPKKASLL